MLHLISEIEIQTMLITNNRLFFCRYKLCNILSTVTKKKTRAILTIKLCMGVTIKKVYIAADAGMGCYKIEISL